MIVAGAGCELRVLAIDYNLLDPVQQQIREVRYAHRWLTESMISGHLRTGA